jgi:hypothetical protein
MNNEITITWRTVGNSTQYSVNEKPVGTDETGFSQVVKFISSSEGVRTVRLKFTTENMDDGKDLAAHFPFYKHYAALSKIIADKNMVLELIPDF